MSEQTIERWDVHLRATARAFPYPPTPDVAGAVRRQLAEERGNIAPRGDRLAWVAAVVVLILVSLLAVPPVRATVVAAVRLGVVRVLFTEPTPTATAPTPTDNVPSSGLTVPAATPRSGPPRLASVPDLVAETVLADAQQRAGSPIRLPTPDPRLSNGAFSQRVGGQVRVEPRVYAKPATNYTNQHENK